jgi:transposase
MWSELRKMDIEIGESTVRMYCREKRPINKPAFVPLDFAAGERAEFDFGEAAVHIKGQVLKVPFLAGRLRFCGAMFVESFPTQRQEAFLLGQRHAFEFWGGVPRLVVYANLKPAVQKSLAGHSRREQEVFQHFPSVYRFEALFANVAAGWEKGSVENLVGYARGTYFVPLPEGPDLEPINAGLHESCKQDQLRTMSGRSDPIATRLVFERAHLGPLPAHPPDLGPIAEVLVHSSGRVRFQTNDYSAPLQYASRRLRLKADPFRVRLYAGSELVADHPRSYEQQRVIEDWRHDVPVLLQKSLAIPWASALRHGELPSRFESARLDLLSRRADGNREFARILELCLTHELAAVEQALARAREQGGCSADTVRQWLLVAQQSSTPVLPLDPVRYPAYQATAPVPDLVAYHQLLQVRS